nr:hypothetical protein [Streptomyces sp. RLA2-12]
MFGGAPLSGTARVPERLGHLLRGGVGGVEQLLEALKHAQRGGVPKLVDPGTAGGEKGRDVPAGIADGVVERSADGTVGCFDVGAGVDQGGRDIDVIAAGRPVQRVSSPGLRVFGSAPAATSSRTICGPLGK